MPAAPAPPINAESIAAANVQATLHWQGAAGVHVSQPDPPKKKNWADMQHVEGEDEDDADEHTDKKAATEVSGASGTSAAASSADDIMATLGKPTGKMGCTDGGLVV